LLSQYCQNKNKLCIFLKTPFSCGFSLAKVIVTNISAVRSHCPESAQSWNWLAQPCCAGQWFFGKSSHLHTAKILRLSMDLPIVIEIVDSEEKINAFLPVLDEMMGGGLVTLERAKAIRYQDQEKS
jgi:hypothetical protein